MAPRLQEIMIGAVQSSLAVWPADAVRADRWHSHL